MTYRVGFCSLGCKVSQYETEALAERFAAAGFTVSDFDAVCDVYVINTCTVTVESDRKSRQMIRRATRVNPDAVVIVSDVSLCVSFTRILPLEIPSALRTMFSRAGSEKDSSLFSAAS